MMTAMHFSRRITAHSPICFLCILAPVLRRLLICSVPIQGSQVSQNLCHISPTYSRASQTPESEIQSSFIGIQSRASSLKPPFSRLQLNTSNIRHWASGIWFPLPASKPQSLSLKIKPSASGFQLSTLSPQPQSPSHKHPRNFQF